MNLKQFADMAGCKVVLCGPGWGGHYGYTTDDAPNCTTCGLKTKTEARQRWLADTFGETAGGVLTCVDSTVVVDLRVQQWTLVSRIVNPDKATCLAC